MSFLLLHYTSKMEDPFQHVFQLFQHFQHGETRHRRGFDDECPPFAKITSKAVQENNRFEICLVVSPHLKHISQNGNLPQVGVKIKKCLNPPPRKLTVIVGFTDSRISCVIPSHEAIELPPTGLHSKLRLGENTWVFPKMVGFPPKSSILGVFPLFLETPKSSPNMEVNDNQPPFCNILREGFGLIFLKA